MGSQSLLGIPRVLALQDDQELRAFSRVWPFETGFTDQPSLGHGPLVLHAEIWPGIVDIADLDAEVRKGAIRDQAQVRLMCRWAASQDVAGTLGAWFDSPVLPPGGDETIVDERAGSWDAQPAIASDGGAP